MKLQILLPLLVFGLELAPISGVAQDVITTLREQIAGEPAAAPAAITRTLKAAGPKTAPLLAGPATAAAIQTLGPERTTKQISAIVYAAVRAVPDSALRIVRAAIQVAPNAAPAIASAAARAVPNPWKEVRYQRGGSPEPAPQAPETLASNREPDFKSSGFENALSAVLDPAAPGEPMTLAEAIVQTAVESGQSLADVQTAVDTALYGDPGALFNAVGSPRGISGVGDAGNSNYANEPKLPGGSPPGTSPNPVLILLGPIKPDQSPVSP